MTNETEPRPCPKCGSDDVGIITQTSLFFRDSVEVYVLCGACAAAGESYLAHGRDEDEAASTQAVIAWNEDGPSGRRPHVAQMFRGRRDVDEGEA